MPNTEKSLVMLMTGRERPSALMTDGYKFSMAQAGFPLREETFYFTMRRGGPHYIPFNMREVVEAMLPEMPTVKESAFLTANGYGLTQAMEEALRGKVTMTCAPKGSWVLAKEPVLTVTGPSFLVSWLEPLVIMLNFSIQVATAMKHGVREFKASCEMEGQIIKLVQETLGIEGVTVEVLADKYEEGVRGQILKIFDNGFAATGGGTQAHRAFEVGMRGATCMQQHRMAVKQCKAYGMHKTSNVHLAWELYMIPVGTTGHEHQERWGEDINGFRAIRDMRSEPPSYLFDTYDPINSGIPAAIKAMREDLKRQCSVRCDSGNQEEQFNLFYQAELGHGTRPNYIFEDGYTDERTQQMEAFCMEHSAVDSERRLYGYGGFIVSVPSPSAYRRNNVSAVFKLCFSSGPRKKWSGTPGKDSLPGVPVIFCPFQQMSTDDPDRMVGQLGEDPPEEWGLATDCGSGFVRVAESTIGEKVKEGILIMSPATQAICKELDHQRDKMIIAAGG